MATARAEVEFSSELRTWLETDEAKTLGSLSSVFGDRAFAVTIFLLMVPAALPLPTGGITHVLEGIALVLAAEMVLGRRTVWLPERWSARGLGPVVTTKAVPFVLRLTRRFERHSRPRAAVLFERGWATRLWGALLGVLATAAALAPPFSGLDTLPALGAVVICLGIILADVVLLAVGAVIGAAGTVVIVTVGAAAVRLVSGLF